MDSLVQMIEETKEVRELKRALSVKMGLGGRATAAIGELLHVTPRYVRKWRGRYEREGVGALRVGYRGSESYLSVEQRHELEDWLRAQERVTVEEVRDYIEAHYGVVYQSKQSYYEVLESSGLSYHRTEKGNPKRNEAQVLESDGKSLKKTGVALGRGRAGRVDYPARR